MAVIDEVATFKKHTDSLLFFCCVIFVHKLDIIRKEHVVWLQIFSAATLPNGIKIGQHLTEQLQK